MCRRAASATLLVTVGLIPLAAAGPAPAAPPAERPAAGVAWQACPTYSDDVLRALGMAPEQLPAARVQLDRLQCGRVIVPLDHRKPRGRHITVAITRLKALDQDRRLGSLALNPGGPGGSGYLMPVDVLVRGGRSAALNDRYDLIGFDPRGVGYSTTVDCPDPQGPPPGPQGPVLGPTTEEQARVVYDREVAANDACGRHDPDFLGPLTTLTVAHDLDRVRAALHEPTLNFLGISWGTWLGAVYRSEFPDKVGRMFLDSVAIPRFSLDAFHERRAAATERNFARMAAWIARHDDAYGFGTSAQQVSAGILAVRRAYDTAPRRFTDPDFPVDGALIARLAGEASPNWPIAAQVLAELRDAKGTIAPPIIRELVNTGPPPPPPAGLPQRSNRTMNKAMFCNEDPSRLDFAAAWQAYQRRLAANPVTGRAGRFSAGCAGWPLPVQEIRVHRGGGSLVLAGHRHEWLSPYEWTTQMHRAVGGAVFTVDDDVHGSVLREPGCAAELVSFFDTGRIDRGCPGVPLPTEPWSPGTPRSPDRPSAATDLAAFGPTQAQ